jgi:very-short-patch-repair endonuclease
VICVKKQVGRGEPGAIPSPEQRVLSPNVRFHSVVRARRAEHPLMDIHLALRRRGGAAKTNQLSALGVGRGAVLSAMRAETVIRVRKGWFALSTISPLERRALIDHGFLTCSTAAMLRGLPAKDPRHYHLRANRPVTGERSGRRRQKFATKGASVSILDMVEDYLHCQPAEWSLALLDAIERQQLLGDTDFRKLEARLPRPLRALLALRSAVPESPLESVIRHRLMQAKIRFVMQHPTGPYRVDFLIGHGVVLEALGAEHHANRDAWERDRARTIWLKNAGYEVVEMTYNQLDDWQSVLSVLQKLRGYQLRR